MIQTELLKDGTLIRHYSDQQRKLLQVKTGIVYDEAIDIVPCQYTYEETDTPIGQDELADAINALNILGVE